MEACKKYLGPPLVVPQFQMTGGGYVYSVAMDTPILINCPQDESKSIQIGPGTGYLEIPHECSLHTETYFLPGSTKVLSEPLYHNHSKIPIKVIWSPNETHTLNQINQSEFETITVDRTLKVSLTALRRKLNNDQYLASERHYNQTIAHTSLALNIILFSVFIGSLLVVIYVFRVCRKYQQNKRQVKNEMKSVTGRNTVPQSDDANIQTTM